MYTNKEIRVGTGIHEYRHLLLDNFDTNVDEVKLCRPQFWSWTALIWEKKKRRTTGYSIIPVEYTTIQNNRQMTCSCTQSSGHKVSMSVWHAWFNIRANYTFLKKEQCICNLQSRSVAKMQIMVLVEPQQIWYSNQCRQSKPASTWTSNSPNPEIRLLAWEQSRKGKNRQTDRRLNSI